MTKKTFDLSEHTLDINPRKYSVDKIDIAEIEDFIDELAGSRDYQREAIKNIMKYLWGGSYSSVEELAEENWRNKESIQERFHSKSHFLGKLPLRDKLSGVCHMATGTGKSYVIFAIAYLSILLGKVDRVLILTPSSTIIKKGLREKIHEHMFGERAQKLKKKLPAEYQNKTIKLITRDDSPEDNAIMVENINGIYQYFNNKEQNSIAEFCDGTEEVLVLSDEVHHAYSRLKFTRDEAQYDFDELNKGGRQTEAEEQRRWMKFIREAESEKVKRHIGFTGTPYNQDEFFPDVLYNYTIRKAIDEKYIKEINPILETEREIDKEQRYEQIIQTHYQNREKYSYKRNGEKQVKPITVFMSGGQKSAQKNTEEFSKVLANYLKENIDKYREMSRSEVEIRAREKVICVTYKTKDEVEERFENIEEIDPEKAGGKVEYIFSVQMLTEGWDADNVFQIVPMEEKAFKSKLLISQVLGRGLRVPREVKSIDIKQRYPMLTVTNHDRFSKHIEELLNQVTECELRFTSNVFKSPDYPRYKHHFDLFNINYYPQTKEVEKEESEKQKTLPKQLNLEAQEEKSDLAVTYKIEGKKKFLISNKFNTLDEVVSNINRRFKNRAYELNNFDFEGEEKKELPDRENIEKKIKEAMRKAGIEDEKISKDNKKRINLHFNQYLPQSRKKVIYENVQGDLQGISTLQLNKTSVSAGGLDNFTAVFLSENYKDELTEENQSVIEELESSAEEWIKKQKESGQQNIFGNNLDFDTEYVDQLIPGKQIYTVNPSMFKTPQDLVSVSHKPERTFLFRLIQSSRIIDSWVKSPDKGFYSLDYEYWKKGKDRTIRSFNPDFFIKINLQDYLLSLDSERDYLRELQNKGVEELILVVEIKSDKEMHETVSDAKAEAGIEHFENLSERVKTENPINVGEEFKDSLSQHYKFFLLKPHEYDRWFKKLKNGRILED